ncbi:fungal-specific transcription factor domain-containing protein [Aspergillus californicus]
MDSTAPTTVPPNRRRDKIQFSCSRCRQMKLRCDRQRPCQRCVARGGGPSCTYPTRPIPQARAPARGATDKSNYTPVSPETGSMRSSAQGTVYTSSAHWTSILDLISNEKDRIGSDARHSKSTEQHPQEDPAELVPTGEPHLFSGVTAAATKAELVSFMPERSVVDRHLFWYFNWLPLVFIHKPSFLRQYEAFWANPSDTPVLWLSIVYSILCLTPFDHIAASNPSDTRQAECGSHRHGYLHRVIQCLILGDYSRGGPYAIEALCLYFVLAHSRGRDIDARNWSLYGLIARLALRKGYHREPSRFVNITPFEGELRRRLWMVIYMLDVVVSIQMGLPRLIKDEQCDTSLPRNLLDTDFDEDSQHLPTPRPDTEITPMSFSIAKYKMLLIMAKIADMSLTIAEDEDPCSSPSVKQMDTLLRRTYEQLPGRMKFTSLVDCLGVSPEDVLNRLAVSIVLQKGLIILHRRHVVGERPSENAPVHIRHRCSAICIADSVRTCIGAALQIIEYQDLIYHESQPGGALVSLGSRILATPISHEFLMATSVLCSYLHRVYRGDSDVSGASPDRIHAIENALAHTYGIWQAQGNGWKDAQRATDILGVLIRNLQSHYSAGGEAGGAGGIDIPVDYQLPECQFTDADAEALLFDSFGLCGEGLNDFGSFITW